MTASLVTSTSADSSMEYVENLKNQIIANPMQAYIKLEAIASLERENRTAVIPEIARDALLRFSLSYGFPEIAAILLENAERFSTENPKKYEDIRGQALVATISKQDLTTLPIVTKLMSQGHISRQQLMEATGRACSRDIGIELRNQLLEILSPEK